MSFKENLLKKIEIDRLATQVRHTLGPADSDRRIDVSVMRRLLAFSPLQKKTERDLELYMAVPDDATGMILVLDNELAFYNTSVADVAMRKSPTVKEMVSIRNAIKILNDKDVVVHKKEDSLAVVQEMCLAPLDLSCTPADVTAIATEGKAALEMGASDGVIECLTLFAEMTGYAVSPGPFSVKGHHIIGKLARKAGGEMVFGPMVMYDLGGNVLKLYEKSVSNRDKAALASIREVARGQEDPAAEGVSVIAHLEKVAIDRLPAAGTDK